jgi:hypothetical protein
MVTATTALAGRKSLLMEPFAAPSCKCYLFIPVQENGFNPEPLQKTKAINVKVFSPDTLMCEIKNAVVPLVDLTRIPG